MKYRSFLILLAFLLAGCTGLKIGHTPTPRPTPTPLPTLRNPQVHTTPAPQVEATAQAFLEAWKAENYASMYGMLAKVSQDAITAEDFTKRYQDTALNLTLRELQYEVLSTLTNPLSAQVAYQVTFKTSLLGDLTRSMVMNLALENGAWRVQWEDGMILPELRGGNHLALDLKTPARAAIYDRNGNALVTQMDAVSLGVVPSDIGDDEGRLLAELSKLTGRTPLEIKALYNTQRGANWYVPIGEAPAQEVQDRYTILSGLSGLVMQEFNSRYYFDQGIAPYVTGYVQFIPKERLDEFKRLGYRGDEKVGMSGLEKWGETQLSGKRGASLYVVDSKGGIVTRLVQTDTEPAQAIYSTIDNQFQEQVKRALSGFRGAIVVMERDTGRILALTSYPDFDPNAFEPSNYNSSYLLQDILQSEDRPLINRATQGGYPLGSVFKIITMSAALESGLYTKDTTYNCQYEFTELPGYVGEDWTKAKGYKPSGLLTLPEGLMRSCNPFFMHIGLDLYRQNLPKAVSDLARSFGLGSATGIGELEEDGGNIPDPQNEGDAVQIAFGQSTMLVTPLQVVDFIAAIGNGGTLYRPQVVEKITAPDGTASFTFKPEERGKLPVKPENLQIVRDAMRSVVENRRGTAYFVFTGLNVTIYGKTGTAQNPGTKPHSWFAGYTDSPRTDKPNIAVVVLAENSGEGSEIAAPIFRRVIELYYQGKPGRLYEWESSYYVTVTPTSLYTNTPIPPPTDTPTPEMTPTPIQ